MSTYVAITEIRLGDHVIEPYGPINGYTPKDQFYCFAVCTVCREKSRAPDGGRVSLYYGRGEIGKAAYAAKKHERKCISNE